MSMPAFYIKKLCFKICPEKSSKKSEKGKCVNLWKHPQYWKRPSSHSPKLVVQGFVLEFRLYHWQAWEPLTHLWLSIVFIMCFPSKSSNEKWPSTFSVVKTGLVLRLTKEEKKKKKVRKGFEALKVPWMPWFEVSSWTVTNSHVQGCWHEFE